MQIVGIALQGQTRSKQSSREHYKHGEMALIARWIAEAAVGVLWITLFFPSIYADSSLESVISSLDRLLLTGNWTLLLVRK